MPARVDPATGYRSYRAEQAATVQRVLALKELGFTLAQIGPLLADPPGREELYDRSDDEGIVVHAALPVDADATLPGDRLAVLDRPATDVASTIHLGDVAEMASAYAAVMEWLEARGLRPAGGSAGGSAEVSLERDPEHPERNVTELHVAIEPKP